MKTFLSSLLIPAAKFGSFIMMHLDKSVNVQAGFQFLWEFSRFNFNDGESWKTDHMEVPLLPQA